MAAVAEPKTDRDERWRAPVPPRPGWGLSVAALGVSVATIAATYGVIGTIQQAMEAMDSRAFIGDVALFLFLVLTLALLIPALRSLRAAGRSATATAAGDIVTARVAAADARMQALFALGYAGAAVLILLFGLFMVANDNAVGRTFFKFELIFESFHLVAGAFWMNVYMFVIAEVLVLIWGLIIAMARLLPGAWAQPIRFIATAYVDCFRALPAIICIYLVGFGLSLAGVPIVKDLPPAGLAILALTLTYGAYVAEVYRSGIESIHPSQTAAARSLGLSYGKTMRFVVVPQAVRRIIPPLLNDFISLQKDTALVNVIGAIDGFNQAKIIASNHFNLSSVTTVAFLFILITIPQTRFVDRLIARDQRRMRAGA
jgi:polar amino acid transport system permease protein